MLFHEDVAGGPLMRYGLAEPGEMACHCREDARAARSGSPSLAIYLRTFATATHARSARAVRTAFLSRLRTPTSKNFTARSERSRAQGRAEIRLNTISVRSARLRWRVAALRGRQVFAAGAFDTPSAFEMVDEMYTVKSLPWARIGCEIVRAGAPDEAYRAAVITRTARQKA